MGMKTFSGENPKTYKLRLSCCAEVILTSDWFKTVWMLYFMLSLVNDTVI